MSGGNKEKVLLAAMELFHKKGFQTTGLEEILTQSGVCKSNFYYHFKSKEELGLAVLEEKIKEMHRDFIAPTLDNEALSPKDRIVRFFQEMIRFCDDHACCQGCIFGNFTLELADHHEGMRLRLSEFFQMLTGKVKAVLTEGMGAGSLDLRGMEPEAAATAFVSLLQGGILLTKGHKETAPLINGLEFFIRFIGNPMEASLRGQPEIGGEHHG